LAEGDQRDLAIHARPIPRQKDLQDMAARDFQEGKITPRGVLSPNVAFRDAERAVKLIADEPQRVLKVLLRHD